MFLFRLRDGRRFVHTGDMRLSPQMLANPHMQRFQGAEALFLDTTYCNSRHTFPPQEESIEYVAATIGGLMEEGGGPRRTLYLISTYVIGKERVLLEVYRRTGLKLYMTQRKLGVVQCLNLQGVCIEDIFTSDPKETPIHVTAWNTLGDTWPFFRPNYKAMDEYRQELGYEQVVGFVPTGWAYEMKRAKFPVYRKEGRPCQIHLVPYSEHSSFNELQDFVKFLRPRQVIPTVGVSGEDGERRRAAMLEHFRNLVDGNAAKANFLSRWTKHGPAEETGGTSLLESSGSGPVPLDAEPRTAPDTEERDEEDRLAAPQCFSIPEDEDVPSGTSLEEPLKYLAPVPDQRGCLGGDASAGALPDLAAASNPVQRNGAVVLTAQGQEPNLERDEGSESAREKGGSLAQGLRSGMGDGEMREGGGEKGSVENCAMASLTQDSNLEQLLAVVGPEVLPDQARRLLRSAGGDVARALDMYYEGGVPGPAVGTQGTAGERGPQRLGSTGGKRRPCCASENPREKSKERRCGQRKRYVVLPAPNYCLFRWRHAPCGA
eukprot:jgi/Botrbrau1/425/Bobra.110_2s0075.1